MLTEYLKHCGLVGTTLLVTSLAGCVSTEPVRVDADYGNSVKQMVQAQTFNPEAAAREESIPVEQMDGEMAMRSLKGLREDVSSREAGDLNVINVQIGGGTGGN